MKRVVLDIMRDEMSLVEGSQASERQGIDTSQVFFEPDG